MPDEDPVTSQWRAPADRRGPEPARGPPDAGAMSPRRRAARSAPRPSTVSAGRSHGSFWHGPMREQPAPVQGLLRPAVQASRRRRARDQRRLRRRARFDRPRRADVRRRVPRAAPGLLPVARRSAIDANGGIIDKFLGDGVMALFIPVIAGENHAARAISCGSGDPRGGRAGRPRRARASWSARASTRARPSSGVVGSDEKIDFTALGDTVNIAARLGGIAGPGELLVSRAAWDRAGPGDAPRRA